MFLVIGSHVSQQTDFAVNIAENVTTPLQSAEMTRKMIFYPNKIHHKY